MRNKDIRRKNLVALIERFGKKSTLANQSGASADYISQIANKHRDMGDAFAETLESGLDLPVGWMDDVHEDYSLDNLNLSATQSIKERTPTGGFHKEASQIDKRVPLIAWPDAGLPAKNLLDSHPLRYLKCPIEHGKQTFCIVVKNDAMTANYGKSYPVESVVFIDPSLANNAHQGHRVFARLSNGEFVFKELAEDAGKLFLRSLNQQYPPTFEQFEIIGKIIGKWEFD